MKKRGLVWALCLLLLLPIKTVVAAQSGVTGEATAKDVTLTLQTDKAAYEAGETIEYTVLLENNRGDWNVDAGKFSYTVDCEGLEAYELPTEFPGVVSGDSFTLSGKLAGIQPETPQSPETPQRPETPVGQNTPDSKIFIFAAAAVAVVLVVVIFVLKGKNKKGPKTLLAALLAGSMVAGLCPVTEALAAQETVTLATEVSFTYAGKPAKISISAEIAMTQDVPDRISCHDPSIFVDKDGTYYIYGTHMTGAVTEDLRNWTVVDNEYRLSYTQEVIDKIREWNNDGAAGQWFDYLWAPDIIYNDVMQKYCIYLSANGDDWISNIVLLTSDNVRGPFDYAGTVVYGGFEEDTWSLSDAPKVTGSETILKFYYDRRPSKGKWGGWLPNCIDPCVFYDDEGNLRMVYGSWFGGIFMLELDEATGLRDYSVTYEDYATNKHSDLYFGKKIAGGMSSSGEGAYVQKIGDYYWLFISYGGLDSVGGYNVRVYRSETPDGPYVDYLGNDTFSDSYIDNINGVNKGVRLFGGYRWNCYPNGELAQGHNSAFVDKDGKAYIVFHTRTDVGTEWHYVKVHQLFLNKEGWLCAAPYSTNGEALDASKLSKEAYAGSYDVILHKMEIDYENREVVTPVRVELNADGTVTGAYSGTWSLEEGTSYIILTIDGVTYSGVALEMREEYTGLSTFVFTALGQENQLTLWGSKVTE